MPPEESGGRRLDGDAVSQRRSGWRPRETGEQNIDAAADSNRRSEPLPTRYLGIDPGLLRTGYALLERGAVAPALLEGGVIRSTPKLSLAERVCEIGAGLCEVFDQFQPQVMAIEQIFSTGKYPKPALMMSHARGVILYVAASRGVPVVHYTPRQIKRLLTGSGKASKDQVQQAIRHELGLGCILEPNDVADACAAALCHYHQARLPSLQSLAGAVAINTELLRRAVARRGDAKAASPTFGDLSN